MNTVNPNNPPAPASSTPPSDTPLGPPNFDLSTLFGPGGGGQPGDVTEETSPSPAPNAPSSEPAPTPAVGATPAGATPPATPPTPGPIPQVEQFGEATRALTAAAQALAARSAPEPTPAAQPEQPRMWVTPEQIPQPMAQLLTSEDPAERLKGFAFFGNALLHTLHQAMTAEIREQYQPQFMQLVQDHYTQQQQVTNWKNEFSQEYPVLVASDEGRMVAQLAIQQTAQKMQAAGVPAKEISWNHPKFKETFNGVLAALKINPKGTPAPASPPVAPPPPPPRISRSSGARPEQPSGENNSQQDGMMAVLRTAGVLPRAN